MPQLGAPEIIVIFVVALLVFGPQRLPEIGRQIGRGIRELRSFQQHLRDDIGDAFDVSKDDDDEVDPAIALLPAPEVTSPDGTARDGTPAVAPGDEPQPGTTT